jgi:hypothetical protein
VPRKSCLFGLHRWLYGIDLLDKDAQPVIVMVRFCSRCHRLEEVPTKMRSARHLEVKL